jgi:prepilin-type N-terminal cleavage/methylation domain-containing protein
MKLTGPSRCRAFTLLEIMVALFVFSLLIAAVYSTWSLVMKATQVGQTAADRAQRERVAMRTIGDALMGIESFQASQKYYWFNFQNGSTPFLSFAAHLPESFPHSRKNYGTVPGLDFSSRRVLFQLEEAGNGEKNLVLRQVPILMEMEEDEKKYPCVLARDVRTFTVECWATNQLNHAEWSSEWDEKQTNSIPSMLRVTMVLNQKDAHGMQERGFAVTRIYTVPSAMMPVQVQRGGLGGPGGPGGGMPPPISMPVGGKK